jgi:hypothetical protein
MAVAISSVGIEIASLRLPGARPAMTTNEANLLNTIRITTLLKLLLESISVFEQIARKL